MSLRDYCDHCRRLWARGELVCDHVSEIARQVVARKLAICVACGASLVAAVGAHDLPHDHGRAPSSPARAAVVYVSTSAASTSSSSVHWYIPPSSS
jgi:hypothetical protein